MVTIDSPQALAELLDQHAYLADDGLATAGFLALRMRRPLEASVTSCASWARRSAMELATPARNRLDGVRMARKKMWVRHDKAARELGYSPGPAAGALERAVEWFRANGYA